MNFCLQTSLSAADNRLHTPRFAVCFRICPQTNRRFAVNEWLIHFAERLIHFFESAFRSTLDKSLCVKPQKKGFFTCCFLFGYTFCKAFDSSPFRSFRPPTTGLCGLPPFVLYRNALRSGRIFRPAAHKRSVCPCL